MKEILENITDFGTQETDDGIQILQLKIKRAWYTLNIRDYVEINPETGRWKKKYVVVESGRKTSAEPVNRKPKTVGKNETGHYLAGPAMHRAGLAEREEN